MCSSQPSAVSFLVQVNVLLSLQRLLLVQVLIIRKLKAEC